MKIQPFLLVILFSFQSFGTVFKVGTPHLYKTPNELYTANVVQNGDTIEIEAETYVGTAALAVWDKNNLYIKGVGGRPILNADGENIWGKGIWVLAGDNITVENIEFYGATVPDNNGAGIRLDGVGMNVQHCYFHDNENGILTGNPYAGEVIIEHSEFANNGYRDGYSHNVYIGHVGKLVFRFNYSHHAKIGHNLKTRANENIILYNRIMDEERGTSSRLIDVPNGGYTVAMGNVLMQGSQAENNNAVGYGLEGLSNSNNEFNFINNTLINKRATCLFLNIASGAVPVRVVNNIFAGNGDLYSGNITELSNNLVETSIAAVGLIDEANYDYRLESTSPAINAGKGMTSDLTPMYVFSDSVTPQGRTTVQTIDIGAYELDTPCNIPCLTVKINP